MGTLNKQVIAFTNTFSNYPECKWEGFTAVIGSEDKVLGIFCGLLSSSDISPISIRRESWERLVPDPSNIEIGRFDSMEDMKGCFTNFVKRVLGVQNASSITDMPITYLYEVCANKPSEFFDFFDIPEENQFHTFSAFDGESASYRLRNDIAYPVVDSDYYTGFVEPLIVHMVCYNHYRLSNRG